MHCTRHETANRGSGARSAFVKFLALPCPVVPLEPIDNDTRYLLCWANHGARDEQNSFVNELYPNVVEWPCSTLSCVQLCYPTPSPHFILAPANEASEFERVNSEVPYASQPLSGRSIADKDIETTRADKDVNCQLLARQKIPRRYSEALSLPAA